MPPPTGDTWCGLTAEPLVVDDIYRWVLRPDCGALVVFTGVARDHAEGRPGVTRLEYEAYDEQVLPRFEAIVVEAHRRWPDIGRVAVLHRTGPLELTEAAVVVAVAAPHRSDAFEAARYCIDTVKADAPIWKREVWSGGSDWAHSEADSEAEQSRVRAP
jgi:molybdopterin synthase catalytic subunit